MDATTSGHQRHELLVSNVAASFWVTSNAISLPQPSPGSPKFRRPIKRPLPPLSCMQLPLLPRILLRWPPAYRARGPAEAYDVGRRGAMCLLHLHISPPVPDRQYRQRRTVRSGRHRLFLLVLCVLRDLLAGESLIARWPMGLC